MTILARWISPRLFAHPLSTSTRIAPWNGHPHWVCRQSLRQYLWKWTEVVWTLFSPTAPRRSPLPHHPSASTTPSPPPLYLPGGPLPHELFPLRSRASAVRPCRFTRFILCLCARPSALLPSLLYIPFLFHQRRLLAFLVSRVRAKSTRAAAAAVCPPNYAEFISYGARHACRQPLPVTFIPAVIYERKRAVYTVYSLRLPFSRDSAETHYFSCVRLWCDFYVKASFASVRINWSPYEFIVWNELKKL